MNKSVILLASLLAFNGCNESQLAINESNISYEVAIRSGLTPGNQSNAPTLDVRSNDVDYHLENHDYHIGECSFDELGTCNAGTVDFDEQHDSGSDDSDSDDSGSDDSGSDNPGGDNPGGDDTGGDDTGGDDTGGDDTGGDTGTRTGTGTGGTNTVDTGTDTGTDTGNGMEVGTRNSTDTGMTADAVWVQGGCNTSASPIGFAGILISMVLVFSRRKELV